MGHPEQYDDQCHTSAQSSVHIEGIPELPHPFPSAQHAAFIVSARASKLSACQQSCRAVSILRQVLMTSLEGQVGG